MGNKMLLIAYIHKEIEDHDRLDNEIMRKTDLANVDSGQYNLMLPAG